MLNRFSTFDSTNNNKIKNTIKYKLISNNFSLYKKFKPIMPKINVLNSLSYKNNYETTISSIDSKLLLENKINKINKTEQNLNHKINVNSFNIINKSFDLNKKSLFNKKLNNIKLNTKINILFKNFL